MVMGYEYERAIHIGVGGVINGGTGKVWEECLKRQRKEIVKMSSQCPLHM